MAAPQQQFDPGLTQQYSGRIRRTINKDGSFNVHRGGTGWRNTHVYLWLTSMPWMLFHLLVVLTYVAINAFFAALYLAIGVEHLAGAAYDSTWHRFVSAFFFSVQTFTTVGYGTIAPKGTLTSLVAAFEALAGLMSVALATGLLYGRFSKPTVHLLFSDRMLMAPFRDGWSLQFRVANGRPSVLMEIEARVLLMTVQGDRRQYAELFLERQQVLFLPLTWTLVHPLTPESPLYGKTAEDLERLQAEALIVVKCFDETFGQVVHARHSYTFDEIVWRARFLPAFNVNADGDLVLAIDRLSAFEKVA